MSLVILVTNIKGGCGKTTIATNLAAAFANAGFVTALADADRQKSSLDWLAGRPRTAAPIQGLDWRKGAKAPPAAVRRVVIDAPAGVGKGHVEDLLKSADRVVVPILASAFDSASTLRFLKKLEGIKPIAKGKKAVLVVANRQRPRQNAARRLSEALRAADLEPVASLTDRTLYADLAADGLAIFDVSPARAAACRADWLPLLQAIEVAGR